jgi:hypothetical protein
MYIVTKDVAEAYRVRVRAPTTPGVSVDVYPEAGGEEQDIHDGHSGTGVYIDATTSPGPTAGAPTLAPAGLISQAEWSGDVTPLQWMNFYMKVLTRFVNKDGVALQLHVDVAINGDISKQQADEMRQALRDLGLDEDVRMR